MSELVPAFLLGFALGAAPGPVQLLILSQTARLGILGGLRVMLGANGTLLVVMMVRERRRLVGERDLAIC
jgi:threonine/homoserine/homoserine lactone efflux protein